eukprot:m.223740 g.223740  ORF g.223740 m.223740 type:complete len:332 (-) comp16313_c0_seq1:194-1189(-)
MALRALALKPVRNVRNASTLVYIDHDGKTVTAASRNAVTAAQKLGGEITALVAGSDAGSIAAQVGKFKGVTRVLHANGDKFPGQLPEALTPVIVEAQKQFKFSHILGPATASGKNVLPRVAAKLDVAMLSEITGVLAEDTFTRNIYAGNAVTTVRSKDPVKIATVRATAFDACPVDGGSAAPTPFAGGAASKASEFVGQELVKSERPDLATAPNVVCGGRALKSADNFKILFDLADVVGNCAVGATRAAVDAGYATNDMQIGQTGKLIAPNLYFGFGVSGAIQHLAGMKDSKVIVCVNKDPEAPLFQVADYGIVADLFKVVPELTAALKKK